MQIRNIYAASARCIYGASMRVFSTGPQITDISPLTAISPIDGRYAKACHRLRPYFSEYALMRYRIQVELHWFTTLFNQQIVSKDAKEIESVQNTQAFMQKLFDEFSLEDAERVKEIEKTTNHDVKAIEYFLKEKFETNAALGPLKEYLHFSCTSEDINNLAYALMLNNSMNDVLLPQLKGLQQSLALKASTELSDIPMLCRTHGQSATPSTMGKEFANYAYRLKV